jgi:hypothetical protein
MGGVPTDSVVDLCGRPSAPKVRPLDVPETCTLRVDSPVFQVSFANIPKETVRFHWGAYNAVGQCQSADTEYKTSQYFVFIMKNFSLWTCIFNFMNCMSNRQLERPYCMSGRQNACPWVNCMSNMHFGFLPGKDMHFGKQYTCPQGTMFSDMHIRK